MLQPKETDDGIDGDNEASEETVTPNNVIYDSHKKLKTMRDFGKGPIMRDEPAQVVQNAVDSPVTRQDTNRDEHHGTANQGIYSFAKVQSVTQMQTGTLLPDQISGEYGEADSREHRHMNKQLGAMTSAQSSQMVSRTLEQNSNFFPSNINSVNDGANTTARFRSHGQE